nr:hypothetical protein GCM10020093_045640 [Planobispora longispora]
MPALYPVGDIVLLAASLFLALSPGDRGAPTRLLLASVSTYLAVDLGYNVLPMLEIDYLYVEKLGAGLLLGHALLVTAALHPHRAELTRSGTDVRALHPARVVFLGMALLGTPALALRYAGFSEQEVATIVASAACAAFVLARFTGAVREQERIQAQLAYQARHDPLTGLANRTVLHEALEQVMRGVPAGEPGAAVLYLDLDGFKEVNDVHGHEAGDAVLRAVAGRLAAAAAAPAWRPGSAGTSSSCCAGARPGRTRSSWPSASWRRSPSRCPSGDTGSASGPASASPSATATPGLAHGDPPGGRRRDVLGQTSRQGPLGRGRRHRSAHGRLRDTGPARIMAV